jgi:DNA-binding transcriptional ArsR family regulator
MRKRTYPELARWFLALSHPMRLRILDALLSEDRCVADLQIVLGKSQPYVSQQLHVLRACGMLKCRQMGQFRFYCLVDPLAKRVLGMLRKQPW